MWQRGDGMGQEGKIEMLNEKGGVWDKTGRKVENDRRKGWVGKKNQMEGGGKSGQKEDGDGKDM